MMNDDTLGALLIGGRPPVALPVIEHSAPSASKVHVQVQSQFLFSFENGFFLFRLMQSCQFFFISCIQIVVFYNLYGECMTYFCFDHCYRCSYQECIHWNGKIQLLKRKCNINIACACPSLDLLTVKVIFSHSVLKMICRKYFQ